MSNEIWKPIKGYETLYSVSNLGRVRSEPRYVRCTGGFRFKPDTILRPYDNGNGYLATHFHINGKRTVHYIHRLVADAFIENPYSKPEVNHLDYNRKNNCAWNLEWCTDSENTRYSIPHMRGPKKKVFSNTGERYISFRRERNEYRLTVPGNKEMRFKNLNDAVSKRKELIGA